MVVARAANEHVVAVAPRHSIVAIPSNQNIRTVQPIDNIVATGSVDQVAADIPIQVVRAIGCQGDMHRQQIGISPFSPVGKTDKQCPAAFRLAQPAGHSQLIFGPQPKDHVPAAPDQGHIGRHNIRGHLDHGFRLAYRGKIGILNYVIPIAAPKTVNIATGLPP